MMQSMMTDEAKEAIEHAILELEIAAEEHRQPFTLDVAERTDEVIRAALTPAGA